MEWQAPFVFLSSAHLPPRSPRLMAALGGRALCIPYSVPGVHYQIWTESVIKQRSNTCWFQIRMWVIECFLRCWHALTFPISFFPRPGFGHTIHSWHREGAVWLQPSSHYGLLDTKKFQCWKLDFFAFFFVRNFGYWKPETF